VSQEPGGVGFGAFFVGFLGLFEVLFGLFWPVFRVIFKATGLVFNELLGSNAQTDWFFPCQATKANVQTEFRNMILRQRGVVNIG
jgi:hypothetical protein